MQPPLGVGPSGPGPEALAERLQHITLAASGDSEDSEHEEDGRGEAAEPAGPVKGAAAEVGGGHQERPGRSAAQGSVAPGGRPVHSAVGGSKGPGGRPAHPTAAGSGAAWELPAHPPAKLFAGVRLG